MLTVPTRLIPSSMASDFVCNMPPWKRPILAPLPATPPSGIAPGHGLERGRAVADDAGEDVEAARGRFRVGEAGQARRERERFAQGDQIDAARFQHGPVGEVDFVQRDALQRIGDAAVRARQKGGAQAHGALAKGEIERGGLQLGGIRARDETALQRGFQHLAGQDAVGEIVVGCGGCAHDNGLGGAWRDGKTRASTVWGDNLRVNRSQGKDSVTRTGERTCRGDFVVTKVSP